MSSGDGQFLDPRNIALDSSGNVYVVDIGYNRIQKFTSDGQFITKFGTFGPAPGQFNWPAEVIAAPNGLIYIADTYNNRIQVFRQVTTNSRNKAIIVAGGGAYPGNDLWDATQMSANFAYRTLTYQGFTKESVHYLTSANIDLDDNGVLGDIAGDATNANLQNALTIWASGAEDVIVYLVDHGGEGSFRMSGNETLSAIQFSSWLNTLQSTISGKVTVIYDAPQSGSFLPVLAPPSGKQRIVISSAGSAQPANFLSSGDISFSKYFWSRVLNGMNVRDAYLHGKRAMSFLSGNQVAYLDDNGNGIGNEKADGQQALNYAIGFGITLGADDPMIGAVSPSQTLTGAPSATIWAKDVTTTGMIAKVWAVITPPGAGQNPNIPITDFPSIDLLYNATSNRYEGTYYRFNTQGDYSITISARDDEGNISLPSSTTVTQTTTLDPYEDDNSPAHASVIVLNDTAPQTHTFHAQGDEDWVKFYALKDVTYVIEASNLGPNADVVLRLYDGDGTTRILGPPEEGCPPENQQCLGDEGGPGMAEEIPWTAQKTGIYYVRVKNYDPTVYGTGTNYDLKVYRPTAPEIGTIRGIIISDRNLSRIAGASIQAGLGSALSQDGSFILKVEAGTVDLSVNIEGFNSKIGLEEVIYILQKAAGVR